MSAASGTGIQHRFVETNGIRLHIAEQGEGPLVLLCHGFPESWYSWRHQLPALAAAGFHAVAPDMRGYGQSDRPEPIEQYTIMHLVGDLTGLLDALGERTAVIAGHDWGAIVAWNAALLRPERFPAVIGMSVPFSPRGSVRPTDAMKRMAGDNFFYILYFQEPGKAEAELEADPKTTMRKVLFTVSGDSRRADALNAPLPKSAGFLDGMQEPAELPPWLSEADLDFYANEFRQSGFRGPINWYRNFDRNWELLAPWHHTGISQPALFIAGDRDGVIRMSRAALEQMPKTLPGLRRTLLLEGAGHWTQQERPAEVNAAMIEFLNGL